MIYGDSATADTTAAVTRDPNVANGWIVTGTHTFVADGTLRPYLSITDVIDPAAGNVISATGTATVTLSAPTNLSATAVSTSQVNLAWTLVGTPPGGSEIDRSSDGGVTFTPLATVAAGVTSYADTSALEGTDYQYQVIALGTANSPPCDPVEAWSLPAAPTSFYVGYAIATASNQATLTWSNNTHNTDAAMDIERSSDGGVTFNLIDSVAATDGTYTDATVEPAQSYVYRVLAANPDGGESTVSNEASITTPSAGVSGLAAASVSSSAISLNWTALAGDAASGYNVYRSADGGRTYTLLTDTPLAADALGYYDAGLSQDTAYTYQVTALMSDSQSGDPTETGGTVAAAWTLAAAPGDVTATASTDGTQVNLTWTNNASTATTFNIERADASGSDFQSLGMTDPGATSYADTTVADGTSYVYRVSALSSDPSGQTPQNPCSTSATVDIPLAAPSGLTATADGAGGVMLQWTNHSQTAAGLSIERSTDAGFASNNQWFVVSPDASNYDDASGTLATLYYYRITAYALDASGPSLASEASNSVSAATGPCLDLAADKWQVNEGVNYVLPVESATATPPTWQVDWGDGSSDTNLTNASHVYATAGVYTIVASTVDGSYSQSVPLTVNVASMRLINLPNSMSNDNVYTVTLVIGFPAGHPVTNWYADFGDGTIESVDAQAPAEGAVSMSHTFTHQFRDGSLYGVVLYARNDQGMSPVAYGVLPPSDRNSHAGGTSNPGWSEQLTAGFSDNIYANQATSLTGEDDIGSTVYGVGVNFPDSVSFSIDWGDGSPPSTTPTSTTVYHTSINEPHTYKVPGVYLVSVASSTGFLSWTEADVIEPQPACVNGPILAVPPTPPVAAGQPLDVSAPFSGLNPYVPSTAFVDWADGTGPHPATITFDGPDAFSGHVTAHLAHAPATLLGTPTISLYDTTVENDYEPNYYHGTIAHVPFWLNIWSAVLGDGTNADVLAASVDGTKNLQELTLSFPHPDGESFDITLTTTNASEDLVWDTSNPARETRRCWGTGRQLTPSRRVRTRDRTPSTSGRRRATRHMTA